MIIIKLEMLIDAIKLCVYYYKQLVLDINT